MFTITPSMSENLHLKIVLDGANGLSVTHLDMEKSVVNYRKLRDTLDNLLNIPRQSVLSFNCSGERFLLVDNDDFGGFLWDFGIT